MSLRDKILSVKDFELVEVEVPEWEVSIYLKPISGMKRAKLESMNNNNKPLETIMMSLLVDSIVDENGNQVFTDEDIEKLGNKNSKVIYRIFTEALTVSGLSDKEIEELEKNL